METLSSDKVFFYCIFAESNRGNSFGYIRKIKIEFTMKPDGII